MMKKINNTYGVTKTETNWIKYWYEVKLCLYGSSYFDESVRDQV